MIVASALVLVALLLHGPAVAGGAGARQGERPARTRAFINSVGVNIHSTYVNTAYASRARVRQLARPGCPQRPGWAHRPPPGPARVRPGTAQYGILTTFIMGAPDADVGSALDV